MNDSSSELFSAAEVTMESPRLKWLKEHGVITYQSVVEGWPCCWYAGFQAWRPTKTDPATFFAIETGENGDSRIGTGDTEDEALADLLTCGYARERGLKLWNEQEAL